MSETTFPIAETFHSLQGEGRWTGTPMFFIRLAGCSVGKLEPDDGDNAHEVKLFSGKANADITIPILSTTRLAWRCRSWDGRKFWCDTDFNKYRELTITELLSDCYEEHVCLTGGEPLIHLPQLEELIASAVSRGKMVHLETSGTIVWRDLILGENLINSTNLWVTVAPKWGADSEALANADEIKLLVDRNFTASKIPPVIKNHKLVYLQPINREMEIDEDNLKLTLEWLKKFPHWHLSVQLHKYLGVR